MTLKPVLIKNTLITLAVAGLYPFIKYEIFLVQDKDTLETLLIVVGLMLAASLMADFEFSYERINERIGIMLGHTVTTISMLLIGTLLMAIDIAVTQLVGNLIILHGILLMFWILAILYDVWDYRRLHYGRTK